ncbi:hypothetical protein C6366_08825 [Desulfonatronum sp. SC1]|nr:hypothetical protein C6366_08825 [Desulfonatronum sp. SC1]
MGEIIDSKRQPDSCNSKGDAALMSRDEYESIQETLELLSTPGFREDFQIALREADSGDTLSFEKVFEEKQ